VLWFPCCTFPQLWDYNVIHSTAGIEAAEIAMEPGQSQKQTLISVEGKDPFSFAPVQTRILRFDRLSEFPYRC
jgi:hypothetical protein